MSEPIPGVAYGYNAITHMWESIGRPSLIGSLGLYPSNSLFPSDTLYPAGD